MEHPGPLHAAAVAVLAVFVLLTTVVCDDNSSRFSCEGRASGYYADIGSGCQVYHMCDGLGRQFSYHCPNTTLFQQRMLICDHWYMVNCSKSEVDYSANLLIGQRDKPFVDDSSEHPYHRTPRPDLLKHPFGPDYQEESTRQGRAQAKPIKNVVGVATDTNYTTDRPVYFLPSHWSTQYSKDGTTPLPPVKKYNFVPFGKNPVIGDKPNSNIPFDQKRYKLQVTKVVSPDGLTKIKQTTKFDSSTPKGIFITAASGAGLQGLNPVLNSQLDKPISTPIISLGGKTEPFSTVPVTPTQLPLFSETTRFSNFGSQGTFRNIENSTTTRTTEITNAAWNKRIDTIENVEPISIDLLPPKLEPHFQKHDDKPNDTKIEPPSIFYQPPKLNFSLDLVTSTMDPRDFYKILPSKNLEPPKDRSKEPVKSTTTIRSVTKKEITSPILEGPPDLFDATIPTDRKWKELRQRFFIPEYDFPLEQVARPGYESGVSSFQVNPAPFGVLAGEQSPQGGALNPNCPKCDPAFILVPGTCKPCIRIRR